MSDLCKLKGHMWYADERKVSKRNDGIYSIVIKERCARCGKEREGNEM